MVAESKPLTPTQWQVVLDNQALAQWVANGFSDYPPQLKPELREAAFDALVYAASKWVPSRAKFSTFAVFVIRQKLARWLQRRRERPEFTNYRDDCGGLLGVADRRRTAGADTEDAEEAAAVLRRLRAAVAGLPAADAAAVRAYYLEGREWAAVAAAEGITTGGARARMQQRLRRLRNLMAAGSGGRFQ